MGSLKIFRNKLCVEEEMILSRPFVESCDLTAKLMHFACKQVEGAIIKRKEINCELITQKMYEFLEELRQTVNLEEYDGLPGELMLFYNPKVEGCDNYNLNCKVLNKNQIFGFDIFQHNFDIIQIAVGLNYKGFYSNFVRTLLIDPTCQMKRNYYFLMLLQRFILHHLRHGTELCKVYEAAISYTESEYQYLSKYLKREFGFALSPIFHDDLLINSKTKSIAQFGMVFSINTELIRLEEGNRIYNLSINNTAFVRKNIHAQMLTYDQQYVFKPVIITDGPIRNVDAC